MFLIIAGMIIALLIMGAGVGLYWANRVVTAAEIMFFF